MMKKELPTQLPATSSRSASVGLKASERFGAEPLLSGVEYPTVIVQAPRAVYDDSTEQWTLSRGKLRLLTGEPTDRSLSFDSLRLRVLEETPDQRVVATASVSSSR